MSALQICLVTPGHLGSNPRLVKEADALSEAGYQVHVIYGDCYPPARVRDRSILARAAWTATVVSLRSSPTAHLWQRLRHKMARQGFAWGLRGAWIESTAAHPLSAALMKAALATKADLYLGHCLAALPVVVAAGQRWGARIGFDAEDFHSEEQAPVGHGACDNALARAMEQRWLLKCDHLTAASPLIAEAYTETYGVKPLPILNVFPLREAVAPVDAPEVPCFYWFSQTIGPGRGLEDFVATLMQLGRPCRLDLRGQVSHAYQVSLQALVKDTLIDLALLEPDLPETMVRHAAGYTAGLSLEQQTPRNRDVCLTNKAFTYLLAGVPVILSTTRAQNQLATELGEAAILIDFEHPRASASLVDQWLANRAQVTRSRQSAFRLGRERFNWDTEKATFLNAVHSCLAGGDHSN